MRGEDHQKGEMLLQKAESKQPESGKIKPFASSKVTAASPPNPNSSETKFGSRLLILGVLIFLNSVYVIILILQARGETFPETAEAIIWGFESGVPLLNSWFFFGELMKAKQKKTKKKQEEEKKEEEEAKKDTP